MEKLLVSFLFLLLASLHNPNLAQEKYVDEWPPITRSFELDHKGNLYEFLSTLDYIKTEEGEELFYIANMAGTVLYKFLLERNKGVMKEKFEMPVAGPESLKNGISGFWVEEENKIFVKGNDNDYLKINENVDYLNSFHCDFLQPDSTVHPHPFFVASIKPYLFKNKFILSTFGTSVYEFQKVGSTIDPDSCTCQPILDKSDFQNYWYGDNNMSNLHSFVADGDHIYGSPATSHFIYKINEAREIIDQIDLSLSLLDEIVPIPEAERRSSETRGWKHLARQGFYRELIYDEFQDKIYRSAFNKNLEFDSAVDAYAFPYLLVLDNKEKKTHELIIPDKYDTFNMVATDNGFCLMNTEKENFDKFYFDCFEFD